MPGLAEHRRPVAGPHGLPMVAQEMVMLLHYPPYVSMQQYDYLNNNTLSRWRRLFTDVNGTIPAEVCRFENIVDITPIAAPGSGETSCLQTSMATTYFDSSQHGLYISPMLRLLSDPPSNPSTRQSGADLHQRTDRHGRPRFERPAGGQLESGADLVQRQ